MLYSHFRHLESTAEECGMNEATFHLQKDKMAMITAYASKPEQQLDIRAFSSF